MKKLTALLLAVSLLGISAGAEIYSAPDTAGNTDVTQTILKGFLPNLPDFLPNLT